MPRAKLDNPLFAKTDKPESTLKVLNSKTFKLKDSTPPETKPFIPEPTPESKSFKLSKFKTFKDQLLVRLRSDQLNYLSRLESSIMKGRSPGNKKERITKNSIIRAAIDAIQSLEIRDREIPDEETLLERVQESIKKQLEESLKV
jgi:hypothetical protein